jgi:hypothetical protein
LLVGRQGGGSWRVGAHPQRSLQVAQHRQRHTWIDRRILLGQHLTAHDLLPDLKGD